MVMVLFAQITLFSRNHNNRLECAQFVNKAGQCTALYNAVWPCTISFEFVISLHFSYVGGCYGNFGHHMLCMINLWKWLALGRRADWFSQYAIQSAIPMNAFCQCTASSYFLMSQHIITDTGCYANSDHPTQISWKYM